MSRSMPSWVTGGSSQPIIPNASAAQPIIAKAGQVNSFVPKKPTSAEKSDADVPPDYVPSLEFLKENANNNDDAIGDQYNDDDKCSKMKPPNLVLSPDIMSSQEDESSETDPLNPNGGYTASPAHKHLIRAQALNNDSEDESPIQRPSSLVLEKNNEPGRSPSLSKKFIR